MKGRIKGVAIEPFPAIHHHHLIPLSNPTITAMPALGTTIGFEMEVVVMCAREHILRINRHAYDHSIGTARELTRLAIGDLICRLLKNSVQVSCVNNMVRGIVFEPVYDEWSLEGDSSIRIPAPEGPVETVAGLPVAVEIISRILRPNPACSDEVFKVLSCIKSQFTMTTNRTTGLHIHVGNGDEGFPLATLKKFSMLVVAFERLINSLHPPERLTSRWCNPPSRSAAFADEPETCLRMLEIEQCRTQDDLVDLMNPSSGRDCAYNFTNLLPVVCKGSKLTIEFRQHAGSVDPPAIMSWAKFVVALVEYSHEVSESQHFIFCVKKSQDPSYTIFDLMTTVGRGDLVEFYRGKTFDHETFGHGNSEPAEWRGFF